MQLFERDSTTIQTLYTEVVENELHFSDFNKTSNQYFTKLRSHYTTNQAKKHISEQEAHFIKLATDFLGASSQFMGSQSGKIQTRRLRSRS